MRKLFLGMLGTMLLSSVVGCGGSDNKITTPDQIAPPPSKEKMKTVTPPASDTKGAPAKTNG